MKNKYLLVSLIDNGENVSVENKTYRSNYNLADFIDSLELPENEIILNIINLGGSNEDNL